MLSKRGFVIGVLIPIKQVLRQVLPEQAFIGWVSWEHDIHNTRILKADICSCKKKKLHMKLQNEKWMLCLSRNVWVTYTKQWQSGYVSVCGYNF